MSVICSCRTRRLLEPLADVEVGLLPDTPTQHECERREAHSCKLRAKQESATRPIGCRVQLVPAAHLASPSHVKSYPEEKVGRHDGTGVLEYGIHEPRVLLPNLLVHRREATADGSNDCTGVDVGHLTLIHE